MMNVRTGLGIALLFCTVLSGCGGRGTATRDELNDITPYLDSGRYANTLATCAMANAPWSSCRISTLPPLAMEKPEPTIQDVMERVVVSHDWMGKRFEQLLQNVPKDLMYLFGGVTAVVIDADIRPSYYWNMTGAIYVDPFSLWLTQDEKDSINRKADYREGNGSTLRFRYWGRLSIKGENAYKSYGFDSKEDRTIADIVKPMSSLLFHELAHANDRFPRNLFGSVNQNDRIASATDKLINQYPSTLLRKDMPLTSSTLFQVADILYRGFTPNDTQNHWTGKELGAEFAKDGANDNYGYSSQYEDLAMLFEDAMMNIHFGVEREQAFIEAPDQKDPGCGTAIIGWGVKNRIGDPWVKERVRYAVQALLPDRDYTQLIDALPEPTPMKAGMDWCDMLAQFKNTASTSGNTKPQIYQRPYRTVF